MDQPIFAIELDDRVPANGKRHYGMIHLKGCGDLVDPETLGTIDQVYDSYPWPESSNMITLFDFMPCAVRAMTPEDKALVTTFETRED